MPQRGAVELVKVSKRFGDAKAVDAIDLRIPAESYCCLLGPSGCGKTTTLRMVAGHESVSDGDILINNQNVSRLPPAKRGTAMMFQDYALFPHLDCIDNVAFSLKMRGVDKERRQAEALAQLQRVHMDSYAQRLPAQLSGGQQQRVALARALITNPDVLLLDEPLSALDPFLRVRMREELKRLQKEFGLTYLFISHNLAVVRHIADRVAVMYLGKIVELADQQTLYDNPLHPYTKALLSAIPVPKPDWQPERITLSGDAPNPAKPPAGCHFHPRCPAATAICRTQAPVLRTISDNQQVACHLVESNKQLDL